MTVTTLSGDEFGDLIEGFATLMISVTQKSAKDLVNYLTEYTTEVGKLRDKATDKEIVGAYTKLINLYELFIYFLENEHGLIARN